MVHMGKTRIKSVSRKTLRGREHLEDINSDRSIILKWILYKRDRRMVTGLTCPEKYH